MRTNELGVIIYFRERFYSKRNYLLRLLYMRMKRVRCSRRKNTLRADGEGDDTCRKLSWALEP